MRQRLLGLGLALLALVALPAAGVQAQSFGKNKVQYTRFQWRVLETGHFHVYYYESEGGAALDAARMAERSYARLSHVLRHEFARPIPLVLYASHSQFQETNILNELIDEGTGGVTEFLKRRVLIPFTGSYSELEHVLSHELVHAFQVDILYGGSGPSPNPFSFVPPGWFMEGMAEYLSLGGVDSNTEMWLRDAALQGYLMSIPALEQAADIRVYRFGQSIWEYLARRFGEEKVGQILQGVARTRNVNRVLESATGLTMERFSQDWMEDVRVTYLPQIARFRKAGDFGRELTDHRKDGSNFNVIPAVSPTGDKIAYISDRTLATSLYLASAIDGRRLGRLVKGERTAEYESFRFFTSATDWSPDGSRVAFPAKAGGADALYVLEVKTGKRLLKHRFEGLDALTSPAWSPDGSRIAFSGYSGGRSDLFVADADGGNLVRLTDDFFADRDPRWSPDGTRLAFSTDRGPGTRSDQLEFGPTRIALFDIATRAVTDLPGMEGRNICPFWSPDGREIVFVSDRTGISNLYILRLETGEVRQVSDLLTGVTGITDGSPPLSVSRDGKRLVFSAFNHGGWDLYAVKNPFDLPPVTPKPGNPPAIATAAGADSGAAAHAFEACPVRGEPGGLGRLAVSMQFVRPAPGDTIGDLGAGREFDRSGLGDMIRGPAPEMSGWRPPPSPDSTAARVDIDSLRAALNALPDTARFANRPYRPRLSVDYGAGAAGFGVNTGVAGQAVLSFSDILGNRNLTIAAGVYGSLLESDLLLQYANLSHRTNWGAALFQYRNDYLLSTRTTDADYQSLIYRGGEFLVSRPFNKFTRLEVSLSGIGMSNRVYRASYYSTDEQLVENLGSVFYIDPAVALVKDTAVYGSTGPLDGTRARLSIDHAEGGLSFTNTVLDYRTYLNVEQRYALAMRLLGASSVGNDPRIFRIGGPYTVRSVDYGELTGSKVALANVEFRFPFVDRLITSFPLPFDWPSLRGIVFFDVGGAWGYAWNEDGTEVEKVAFHPFTSDGGFHLDGLTAAYGFGLRMGLGFLVLRYDVAQPTDLREDLGSARHFFTLGVDF